jgi:3-isopropylmalate dehydrogenase
VKYEDVLADALSMHLLRNPRAYDVIATENLFGDILSDEAAMIAGSMGMMPSASLGDRKNRHGHRVGLYEPIHGSAPDIAGEGIANPIAMILSAAMMLRWSFGLSREADRIEHAVEQVLAAGIRSMDLKSLGGTIVGTREMGQEILKRL